MNARLLSRLGQRLADLPALANGGACSVTLAMGGLGIGDYVVELSATSGTSTAERYIAFRVVP